MTGPPSAPGGRNTSARRPPPSLGSVTSSVGTAHSLRQPGSFGARPIARRASSAVRVPSSPMLGHARISFTMSCALLSSVCPSRSSGLPKSRRNTGSGRESRALESGFIRPAYARARRARKPPLRPRQPPPRWTPLLRVMVARLCWPVRMLAAHGAGLAHRAHARQPPSPSNAACIAATGRVARRARVRRGGLRGRARLGVEGHDGAEREPRAPLGVHREVRRAALREAARLRRAQHVHEARVGVVCEADRAARTLERAAHLALHIGIERVRRGLQRRVGGVGAHEARPERARVADEPRLRVGPPEELERREPSAVDRRVVGGGREGLDEVEPGRGERVAGAQRSIHMPTLPPCRS